VSKTVAQPKNAIRDGFESPKDVRQTTFKTCNKPRFETTYLGENVTVKAVAKSIPKCCHFFGLLHLHKKITKTFQKWPKWQKVAQSGRPVIVFARGGGFCSQLDILWKGE
jgi:hypothetical protein